MGMTRILGLAETNSGCTDPVEPLGVSRLPTAAIGTKSAT
jgi:hypothetical protein